MSINPQMDRIQTIKADGNEILRHGPSKNGSAIGIKVLRPAPEGSGEVAANAFNIQTLVSNNPALLTQTGLKRGFVGRIKGQLLSTMRALHFGVTRNARGKLSSWLNRRPEFCKLDKDHNSYGQIEKGSTSEQPTFNWKDDSKGLVVMLHGLGGHPAQFEGHLSAMKKDTSYANVDVKIPFIKKLGDCPMEEALAPIKEMIDDYITHQTKGLGKDQVKISLIGISNGGRLSIALTKYLAENHREVQLLTLATAPVLHGTGIADTLAFRLKRPDESIKEDFKYSGQDKVWVAESLANLPPNMKVRTFIALEDALVYPLPAGIIASDKIEEAVDGEKPDKNYTNTKNYIYKNQGHTSILMGAQDDQIRKLAKHILPGKNDDNS